MMIEDRRAEGGFFEAIVAFMIVTVVITALFANLLYWQRTTDADLEDYLPRIMALSVTVKENTLTVEGLHELLEALLAEGSLQTIGIEIGLVEENGSKVLRTIVGDPLDSSPSTFCDYAIRDCGGERRLPLYYILTLWSYA